MSHEVSLRSTNPAILDTVGQWLADARLRLPRPAELEVEVGHTPNARIPGAVIFTLGPVKMYREGGNITLEWADGTLGYATIAAGEVTAKVIVTEEGLSRTTEFLRAFMLGVCIMLLRRVGMHHVHGASLIDPLSRGWLITGVSGSGKSTTTATLAGQGWRIASDDSAFMVDGREPNTTDLIVLRERLALRADAAVSTGQIGGLALTSRRKTGWFAEELGAEWVQTVTPQILGFPTVHAEAPTRVTRIGAKEALFRLMVHSPWVHAEPDLASAHLELMTRLVRQSSAFDIALGNDMFDNPGLLLELIA